MLLALPAGLGPRRFHVCHHPAEAEMPPSTSLIWGGLLGDDGLEGARVKDPSWDLNEAMDVLSSCFPLDRSSERGASLDLAAQLYGS